MDSKSSSVNVFTNIIVVILFFTLVIVVYNLFIKNTKIEPFENKKKKDKFDNVNNKLAKTSKQINTVYEKALASVYGENKRLICSMVPVINDTSNICKIDNIPYIIYKFPIHIIKLIDDSILAVFNDGRMYQKYSMESTIWQGPIINSMPLGIIPLRMITLGTDLTTLYGVGYDNILYVKEAQKKNSKRKIEGDNNYGIVSGDSANSNSNSINITTEWKQVPNNSGIIYVLFDNKTNFLISIDINGKLFTKTAADITTNNQELVTLLDRPVLRLYYDLNGYMLVIDNNFDMYQFSDIDWKTTPLQIARGANPKKIHDILYDNDGKLFGLIFNTDAYMVQIMKQVAVFYLSDFNPLDMILAKNSKGSVDTKNKNTNHSNNFVMSYQDIMKAKIGSINTYLLNNLSNDATDDDPNFAYQKQIIETKAKLVQFCNDRSSNTNNINYDNYELLADVENNDDKISKLKNVITSLMEYEPERMNIQDKYTVLNS